MGGKKKKEVIDIFPTYSTLSNISTSEIDPGEIRPGEFRDTAVFFSPTQPRAECGITIRFRCTNAINIGDKITIYLTGFKVEKSLVFALEPVQHPENMTFNTHFMAYFSGDDCPKGIPKQSIILKCRITISENTLVLLGVPEAVHITLPDKLILNSPKLKIDGVIKQAENGKIPKAPIMESNEIKKKLPTEDIAELEELIQEYLGSDDEKGALWSGDIDIIHELTQTEVDNVIEEVYHRCLLPIGLIYNVETNLFRSFDINCKDILIHLGKMYQEEYRTPMSLHRELARNFGVKLGLIIVLEDALYVLHGAYYPELCRSSIMVLRLYTMEVHDLIRLFNLFSPPCVHREINSAMRSKNVTMLKKWVNTIFSLSTCISMLHVASNDNIPILYAGLRDLSSDHLYYAQSLKPNELYISSKFTSCVTGVKIDDEDFNPPDNAVIFEIKNVFEAVEIGDCSQYPENREWLLPMMSTFTILSVDVLGDKNNLTKIVLEFKGGLGSFIKESEEIDEEEILQNLSSLYKQAHAVAEAIEPRTSAIAKCIFYNLQLVEKKKLLPEYLLKLKYLEEYAETQRKTRALSTIEDDSCKWLVCTCEQIITDGVIKPPVWESLNKKYSVIVEGCFLKRTRQNKIFNVDNLSIDFILGNIDYGKGPQRLRRVVDKVDTYPFQIV